MSKNVPTRIQAHTRSGKYLSGPINVQRMPYATNLELRIAEQNAMNRYGGISQLENKINSISPQRWGELNVQGGGLLNIQGP